MLRSLRSSFNPWFIYPLMAWAVLGSLLPVFFTKSEIFLAVNGHHNAFLDVLMYGFTNLGDGIGISIVLVLVLLLFRSSRNVWFVCAAIACTVAPALVIQVVKSWVQAPRPLEFFKAELLINPGWVHIRDNWPHLYHRSFPSGHSGGIFSLCCFLSMIIPHQKRRLGLVLLLLALAVGYSRMYVAAHFYLDIFVGSLIGSAMSLLCFALIQARAPRPILLQRHGDEKLIS